MSVQPPSFQLPPANDSVYAWILAGGTVLVNIVAAFKAWLAEDRNAKLSELQRLQDRVDELSKKIEEREAAHEAESRQHREEYNLLMRYSGRLQYLLAHAGVKFPTLEQFEKAETDKEPEEPKAEPKKAE